MIRALTGFSTRNPWKVITLWALLGIALAVAGNALMYRVTESQLGDFLPEKYDSAAALKTAEDKFGIKPDANAVTMLVKRADGRPLDAADQRHARADAAALGRQRIAMPRPEDTPGFLARDYSQAPKMTPGTMAPHHTFVLFTVSLTGNSTDRACRTSSKNSGKPLPTDTRRTDCVPDSPGAWPTSSTGRRRRRPPAPSPAYSPSP